MNVNVYSIEQHPVNPVVPESIAVPELVPGPGVKLESSSTADQLSSEYEAAKIQLQKLYNTANDVQQRIQSAESRNRLKELKQIALNVKLELDILFNQQEDKIFPEVQWAAGGKLGMVSVMKQDRRLANDYFQSFLEAQDPDEALTNLQQACLIISEQIRKVENMIFPLMKWH